MRNHCGFASIDGEIAMARLLQQEGGRAGGAGTRDTNLPATPVVSAYVFHEKRMREERENEREREREIGR